MSETTLHLPLLGDEVDNLRIGDIVYLSGRLFTARDQAHIHFRKLYQKGQTMPFDFRGGAIFHAGPIVKEGPGGRYVDVVGPTTSARMEPYTRIVGEMGVRVLVGKGGMSGEASEQAKQYGCVYLQAAPGCAAKLAQGVVKINGVAWPELGMTEAVWVLEVEHFGPLVVGVDTQGGNLHQQVRTRALEKTCQLYGSGS